MLLNRASSQDPTFALCPEDAVFPHSPEHQGAAKLISRGAGALGTVIAAGHSAQRGTGCVPSLCQRTWSFIHNPAAAPQEDSRWPAALSLYPTSRQPRPQHSMCYSRPPGTSRARCYPALHCSRAGTQQVECFCLWHCGNTPMSRCSLSPWQPQDQVRCVYRYSAHSPAKGRQGLACGP